MTHVILVARWHKPPENATMTLAGQTGRRILPFFGKTALTKNISDVIMLTIIYDSIW